MDLTLTPAEIAFRDECRAWLEKNMPAPYEGHAHKDDPGYVEYLRNWQKKLYKAGWVGLTWPKVAGGQGRSHMEEAIFMEEMARANAPEIIGVLGIALIGPTIIALGTEEQKAKYLPDLLSGEKIWAQAFSEPNAGSDLAALSTKAVREGDYYIVNGQKTWTSYAHISDYCLLLVRTDFNVAKHKGITALLVDMKTPGISLRPLRMMSGDSVFNEIFFTDVKVPVTQILGKENDGWRAAITALMYERANTSCDMLIILNRFLQDLIDATKQLPGNGHAATKDPMTRQKLAQAHIDLEICRMCTNRELSRLSKGAMPGPDGSILKLQWSEGDQRTCQSAMEILGPYGLLTEGAYAPFSYGYLRARGRSIEAGTSEILRNTIAERVLGLPKSY